ncbi:MAG: protein kinase [Planctomycetaceae bacterium]|nr:protein kinase [Planctomycetaceae bacterium]
MDGPLASRAGLREAGGNVTSPAEPAQPGEPGEPGPPERQPGAEVPGPLPVPLLGRDGAASPPMGGGRPAETDEVVRERPAALAAVGDLPEVPGYRVEELIGRGSTGLVYRAVQLAVERAVALKILHPELARNQRIVRRLQREARTMARLGHPHVVSAIDMGQANGSWWYAMELVDGPSLADRLRKDARLSEREALRLFIPLAEALEHLWEHGVVHRDVKPANILIDRTRGAQLADLGLAFQEDDPGLTRQGGTLGTPHYISPEQARDPHAVDIRSDIWSFGATLFHALCGQPPFHGESLAEVLSSVLHARIPDPQSLAPELSGGLALVLRKCLVREESRRYQSPSELRQDLERIRERRNPTVVRSSLDPVDRPGAKWRRAGLVGLVAGAGLVTLIYGIEWRRTTKEQGAAAAPVQIIEFAPLEQLLAAARATPQRLAGSLANLERMREGVPVEASGRWWSVRNELSDILRQRLGNLLFELSREYERHIARRDYVAAAEVLDVQFDSRLRTETGYSAADLPEDAGAALLAWRAERRSSLESATERAVHALTSSAVLHYREVLLHELTALEARQQWRSARALLVYDRERILRAAGADASGLPSEALEDGLADLRADFAARRRALDEAWIAVDRSLREWVQKRAESLAGLVRSEGLENPRQQLEQEFEVELARRGLAREEIPDPNVSAGLAELDRAGRTLEAERALALAEEAQAAFDLRAEVLSPGLMRRRDYGRVLHLWQSLAERLVALEPEAGEERWHGELVRAVERRMHEAELLLGVLERAAEGLRARRGESIDLTVGAIRYRGVVEVGDDPLRDGFRLRSGPARVQSMELRMPLEGGSVRPVVLSDLEWLAGFVDPTRPDALQPNLDADARLGLALLRASESDLIGASRALAAGPWPEGALGAALAQELSSRLLSGLTPAGRDPAAAFDPLELLARLDGGLSTSDPDAALAAVELLLGEHLQQPAVGLRAAELSRRRDELRQRLGNGAASNR